MIPLLLFIFFLVLYVLVFFITHPNERQKIQHNIGFFLIVGVISTPLFFQETIIGRVLASGNFSGKISRSAAEDFVAEKFQKPVLYSWYGGKNFQPAIFVVTKKDGRKETMILNAFSGKFFESNQQNYSDLKWKDFSKRVQKIPQIPPLKVDTEAPKLQITFPKDGQVFPADTESIIVQSEIWDAIDPNPVLSGTGKFSLKKGFNAIVVTGADASGNVGSAFLVVEKL